ncbi:3D domain-containing protein [Patescibacteria group bacterium]|nr:3D domain-containing protein [Patescibacteria group bacterium]MBU1890188.1 3D domain-containing protein [Patescibacteria group bacterium]
MSSTRRYLIKRKFITIIALVGLLELIYPHSVAGYNQPVVSEKKNIQVFQVKDVQEVLTQETKQSRVHLPDIPDRPARKSFLLTVTAYSSSPDETSGNPFITASGARTQPGTVAYNYLPFGTRVKFPDKFGNRMFRIEDRLPTGASTYHVDMWMPSKAEAKQWGVKLLKIEIY